MKEARRDNTAEYDQKRAELRSVKKGQIAQVVWETGKKNVVGPLMEELEKEGGPNDNLLGTIVLWHFPSCHQQTFCLQAGKRASGGRYWSG